MAQPRPRAGTPPPAARPDEPGPAKALGRWLPLLLGALAPVPILARDVVVGGWSASLAALLATSLGVLLFRRRGLVYFHLALLFNCTLVVVLAAQFLRENGDPFSFGGDDRLFFTISERLGRSWAVGEWDAVQFYLHYDSLGYIALGAVLHIVNSFLGDVNPLTIRVLGSFAGATLAPAAWLTARALFGERLPHHPRRVALWVAVFPLLTFYAAMGLRDIWVTAGTAWFVLAQLRAREAPVRAWTASALIAVCILFLRPESLAPLFVFAAVMQLGRARSYWMMLAQGTALAAGAAAVALFLGDLIRELRMLTDYYTGLAVEAAAVGSVGVRLLSLPEPVGSAARFVYTLYIPVPPVTGTGPAEIVPGVGAAVWYFLIPLVGAGLWAAFRMRDTRLPALASAALMLSLLVGISLTSIDVRHKIPMLPLALIFATVGMRTVPPALLKTGGLLYACFLGMLAGMYLLIK